MPRPRASPCLPLDHVEHIGAEGADQLLRVDRADPPDHAGAQILLDALRRGRHRGAQEAGLELEAMVRSLFQTPLAWTNSPAEIEAA